MAFTILISAFMCLSIFFILSKDLKDGAELTDDPSLKDSSPLSVAKSVSLLSMVAPVK